MTIYPNGIDSSLQLPTVAGVDPEDTAINALQAAVIAIETELGVNPHGIYSDVNTRLSIIEARLGPGPVITGGPIDINDVILTGTLSILKGGTGLNSVGLGNQILISNGVGLFYDYIIDDNVDAAAAIAGTKISPDFGSQNIVTTGSIQISSTIFGASGPTITVGTGAPASSPPDGSIYLRTDGSPTASVYTRQSGAWTPVGQTSGTAAAGSATQVQFNTGGILDADAGFTYNSTTNVLSVSDAIEIGSTIGTVATDGTLRTSVNSSWRARDFADAQDIGVIDWTDDGVTQELVIGTYGDGALAKTTDRLSLSAKSLAYFWINNAVSAFTIGKVGTVYGGFFPSTTNFAVVGSAASFDDTYFGGGTGLMFLGNADVVPTTSPASGVIIYGETNVPKYRNPSGTIVSLAPGGSDTYVTFNDAGTFGGVSGFAYNKGTNVLSLSTALAVGAAPATVGSLRLSNTNNIYGRDSTGTLDLAMLEITASDTLAVGNSTTTLEIKPVTTISNGDGNVTITDVIRRVRTTDNTITNIYTWTIVDGAITTVDCIINAMNDDFTAGGSYKRSITFRSASGVVTTIGTIHDNMTDEEAAGWDVTIDDDGAGTGRIRVTGDAVLGVTWGLAARVQVTVPAVG